MKRYRVQLSHDSGKVRIFTSASSPAAAVHIVLKAETAPYGAVLEVRTTSHGRGWVIVPVSEWSRETVAALAVRS